MLRQATIRQPVVRNMVKALNFQFSVGVVPMHAVTYIGYWAYGSGVSSYLLNNVHGPDWLLGVAHLSAFFQAIITLHVILITLILFGILLFLPLKKNQQLIILL